MYQRLTGDIELLVVKKRVCSQKPKTLTDPSSAFLTPTPYFFLSHESADSTSYHPLKLVASIELWASHLFMVSSEQDLV